MECQTIKNLKIEAVYGDGTYDTKGCYQTIHQRGACVIIPPKKCATVAGEPSKKPSAHYLSIISWKRLSGYHKISLAETKIHHIKRLAERVMSRQFDRQVAELTIRAAILNQFTQPYRPHTIRVY